MDFENLISFNSSTKDIDTWKSEVNKTLSFGLLNSWTKWMKTYQENPNHLPWAFLSQDQQQDILLDILGTGFNMK